MLNFPIPYPDELLYSTIARSVVHSGITSPKVFLDEVFLDRKVIATVDLPSRLKIIERLLPSIPSFKSKKLIYAHTMFPLYAPFTTESRRLRCMNWMIANSCGAIHLTLGIAASRIKQIKVLRYCPACLQQQFVKHGEYYWERSCQVYGLDYCLEHGCLLKDGIENYYRHRHQFIPASPFACQESNQQFPDEIDRHLARQISMLLKTPAFSSASFKQWTVYYKSLAKKSGCNKGNFIRYDAIKEAVSNRWTKKWLKRHNLSVSNSQSCWLRSIFRKHRKSFSYLEHIVVLSSFLSEQWCIGDVLAEVKKVKVNESRVIRTHVENSDIAPDILKKRINWSTLVQKQGTNKARKTGGGSLYAWLYRNDKNWLLQTNNKYRVKINNSNNRVNWSARDYLIVRQLIRIKNEHIKLLDSSRWSKRWYLMQLEQPATVEKYIAKIPLTALFFSRYCESISDYQVRRISHVVTQQLHEEQLLKRWKIMRLSGLSEKRLTNEAKYFLKHFFN